MITFFGQKKILFDYMPFFLIVFIFSLLLITIPIISTPKQQSNHNDFEDEMLDIEKQLNDLHKQSEYSD